MSLYRECKQEVDDCLIDGFSILEQEALTELYTEVLGPLKKPFNVIGLPEPSAQHEAILIKAGLLDFNDKIIGFNKSIYAHDAYRDLHETSMSEKLFDKLERVGATCEMYHGDIKYRLHSLMDKERTNVLLLDTTNIADVWPAPSTSASIKYLMSWQLSECKNTVLLFNTCVRCFNKDTLQARILPRLKYLDVADRAIVYPEIEAQRAWQTRINTLVLIP